MSTIEYKNIKKEYETVHDKISKKVGHHIDHKNDKKLSPRMKKM